MVYWFSLGALWAFRDVEGSIRLFALRRVERFCARGSAFGFGPEVCRVWVQKQVCSLRFWGLLGLGW